MRHSAILRIARGFLDRSHPLFSIFGSFAVAAIVALSVMPASERPMTGAGSGLEHVAAFAAAAALFALGNPVSSRRLIGYAVLGCVLLEALQLPLATRHARLSDLLLDVAAAVSVIGFVAALRWLIARRAPEAR